MYGKASNDVSQWEFEDEQHLQQHLQLQIQAQQLAHTSQPHSEVPRSQPQSHIEPQLSHIQPHSTSNTAVVQPWITHSFNQPQLYQPTPAGHATSLNGPGSATISTASSATPSDVFSHQHQQQQQQQPQSSRGSQEPSEDNNSDRTVPATPATTDAEREERRRRNLAASSRFRQRRKMKEKELTARVNDLTQQVADLSKKLSLLEMENTFLRGLILESTSKKKEPSTKPEES